MTEKGKEGSLLLHDYDTCNVNDFIIDITNLWIKGKIKDFKLEKLYIDYKSERCI